MPGQAKWNGKGMATTSLLRRICTRTIFPSPYLLSRKISTPGRQQELFLIEAPLTMALKPDFGPNDTLFPPLPEIRNADVRRQVFTHRSLHARYTHVFEDHPDDLSPDNERYELLGDSVLGLSVTGLLMEMYPGLRVGPSTKIRAMVVGNSNLAAISLKYRLPSRLRLHPAQAIILRASPSVQADVLESFIGGLYLDQGLNTVKNWLENLFRPYAKEAYKILRREYGLPALPTPAPSRLPSPESSQWIYNESVRPSHTVGHLALFNQHIMKGNRHVEWIYSDGSDYEGKSEYSDLGLSKEFVVQRTKATPIWYVKVIVDGEFYGRGRGNTKKAARNEAAKEGLKRLGVEIVS